MLPRVLAYINTRITPDDLSARSRSETTQIHDRFGRLQGNYGRALRPVPRGAGGRQPRMADPPVHGVVHALVMAGPMHATPNGVHWARHWVCWDAERERCNVMQHLRSQAQTVQESGTAKTGGAWAVRMGPTRAAVGCVGIAPVLSQKLS